MIVKDFDCAVLCGHRNEADQNEAFRNNSSTKKWPDSDHNELPSKAVVPFPVDWENLDRSYRRDFCQAK